MGFNEEKLEQNSNIFDQCQGVVANSSEKRWGQVVGWRFICSFWGCRLTPHFEIPDAVRATMWHVRWCFGENVTPALLHDLRWVS
jgi:hypothetical protein